MRTTEGMPRGYTLHYDHQIGWWWSNGWNTSRCKALGCHAVANARYHHKQRLATLPRIRGPICGAVWACKGNGRITSGMTPEEAYSKWLAWQEGAQ